MADFERAAEEAAEAERWADPAEGDHGRRLAHCEVDEDAERADDHARHEESLQGEAGLRCAEVHAFVRGRSAQMRDVSERKGEPCGPPEAGGGPETGGATPCA